MTSAQIPNVPADEPAPAAAPTYWRSLGELENSPEFQEIVAREFPEGVSDAPDAVSRRGFLSVVAASVALAGLTSCRKPRLGSYPPGPSSLLCPSPSLSMPSEPRE
jgi:molybdopterin-containing oxidoreductase family iron-sulfur binding subunit